MNRSKQAASKSVTFNAIGTREREKERAEVGFGCVGEMERSSTDTYTENEKKKVGLGNDEESAYIAEITLRSHTTAAVC